MEDYVYIKSGCVWLFILVTAVLRQGRNSVQLSTTCESQFTSFHATEVNCDFIELATTCDGCCRLNVQRPTQPSKTDLKCLREHIRLHTLC
jgi:hypothetical protein